MLICQEIDHDQSQIIGACLNSLCPKQGLCCFDCLKSFHSGHLIDTIKFRNLALWKRQKQQSLDGFVDNLSQLQSFIEILSNFFQQTNISGEYIENMNYTDLTKEIKKLLLIEEFEKTTMSKISDIVQQVIPLKANLKQILTYQSSSQIHENYQPIKTSSINIYQNCASISNYSSPKSIIVQEINNLIQKDVQKFNLSKQQKHQDIQVDSYGIMARSESIFTQTRYIMSEQIITENSTAQIKVLCGKGLEVGVCHQNIIFKKNCKFEEILDGAYMLNNGGILFQYTQNPTVINCKAFSIISGDIIIVDVDLKKQKIVWTNERTQKNYNLNLPYYTRELYFLFGLTSEIFEQSALKII